MTFKIEISQFYDQMGPKHNGNKTKSDIIPWDIFKSDVIYFFIKKY